MRKLIYCSACAVILSLSMPASSAVYGGSNLNDGHYPNMENPPFPPTSNDKDSLNAYKAKVMEYIRSSELYVDNANDDIKRINASKSAVKERAKKLAEENGLQTNLK